MSPRPPASLRLLAAGLTVLAASCGDDSPTAPGASLAAAAPVSSISAGAPGTAMFFLSPLASDRAYAGTFDGTRAPVVEVCAWTGTACVGAPVVRFTTTGDGKSDFVRVVAGDQLYRASWKMNHRPVGAVYRVRVLLDGGEMGHADLKVHGPGVAEAAVAAAGYTPVSQNQTFHIQFRLETSANYLPGAPGAPAATTIPELPFVPRAADYSTTHPAMPGAHVSHNTALVVVAPSTSVAALNALLADMGATVAGAIPGATGTSAILALRLPSTTHQAMDAFLRQLGADPRVAVAVQDALVGENAAPRPAEGVTRGHWTWDGDLTDGNWGLELTRAPQAWNLNPAVRKALGRPGAAAPLTGVIDRGFAPAHPDIVWEANLQPDAKRNHGMHVAGIIGATFDNGEGIDGANPFARLVVSGTTFGGETGDALATKESAGGFMLFALGKLLATYPAMRVVNMSVGYNFSADRIANSNPAVQELATRQGATVVALLRTLQARNGTLPVLVVSAGNDSDAGLGPQEARYNSPMAAAGLVHHAAPVIVVGATQHQASAVGRSARMAMSNTGPHLYAPGDRVLSLQTGDYDYAHGTSQAAPYVAALAGYLYTLRPDLPAPTLTTNPMRDLLVASGAPAAGAGAPQIDFFAAALDADRVRGDDRVLRMLTDVDDGTPDGNTRVTPGGLDDAEEDADHDGGAGDGRVDMADFRRWRDWLLQVEADPALALDGTAASPKKDVNANHRTPAEFDDERLHPRGDFNGDGQLSRTAMARVPGAMRGLMATDLQVLQRTFADSTYGPADLEARLSSGDLHVDAARCLALPGVVRVRSHLWKEGDAEPVGQWRTHDAGVRVRIYTEPVGGSYQVAVEALDAGGAVVGRVVRTATFTLGGDARWTAECGAVDRLVFSQYHSGRGFGISMVKPDGSALTELTNTTAQDEWPVLSPDGRQVAFIRKMFGGDAGRLMLMNADGTNVRAAVPGPGTVRDNHPTWSPDGKQIAFEGTRDIDGRHESGLWVVNADGTGLRTVSIGRVADGTYVFAPSAPAWSPDGTRILAVMSGSDGQSDLFTVHVSSGAVTRVTNSPEREWSGAWSPDSRRIAYAITASTAGHRTGVFAIGATGGAATTVAGGEVGYADPTWSPTGAEIAFVLNTSAGRATLVAVPAGGGTPRTIMPSGSAVTVMHPHWR